MTKEYISWKAFTEKVKEISNKYIGTCNKKAYGDIAREVQEYIDDISFDNSCSELKSLGGQIILDTRETDKEYVVSTSNIGEMVLFEYEIEWKRDKRNNNPTGTILNIKFSEKAPDVVMGLDLIDIPQCVHYLLAKNNREMQLKKIAEYEDMIARCKEGVVKFEGIMKSEAWDKSMLLKDMEG